MMRRTTLFVLLASFVVLLPGMTPPGTPWQRISSEACRASFRLPRSVQPDTTTQIFGQGSRLTRYKYDVVQGRRLYDVTCGVYPSRRLRTDGQRSAVLASMVNRLKQKGEVVRSGKLRVAGRPGRQVAVAVQGGRAIQYHRLVAAGHRLIILTAGRWQNVDPAEDAVLQRFFGSLKLW